MPPPDQKPLPLPVNNNSPGNRDPNKPKPKFTSSRDNQSSAENSRDSSPALTPNTQKKKFRTSIQMDGTSNAVPKILPRPRASSMYATFSFTFLLLFLSCSLRDFVCVCRFTVYLFIYLFVCLFVCLFLSLFVCLFVFFFSHSSLFDSCLYNHSLIRRSKAAVLEVQYLTEDVAALTVAAWQGHLEEVTSIIEHRGSGIASQVDERGMLAEDGSLENNAFCFFFFFF
jgi:hypothetical protein